MITVHEKNLALFIAIQVWPPTGTSLIHDVQIMLLQ